MQVLPIAFNQFQTTSVVQKIPPRQQCDLIESFCKTFKLPTEKRNHSTWDENLVVKITSYKENALQSVLDMLSKTDDEKDATAGLFLLNRIIDAGVKNVGNAYPVVSKFNYNPSHNVQVMLAGIYRKTLVPDAFGPLITMFIKNAKHPVQIPFDPNEEVGGAILEYLRSASATNIYN